MTNRIYQVLWSKSAQQDLKRIIEYISADSKIRARKTYLALKKKAANLEQMPLRGRNVPELWYFSISTYRELIIPPWRLIYKVDKDTVLVLALIDGRRNVEDILFDRLI